MKFGLRSEFVLCQSKWSVGVDQITAGLIRLLLGCGESGHLHLLGMKSDFNHLCLSLRLLIVFTMRHLMT